MKPIIALLSSLLCSSILWAQSDFYYTTNGSPSVLLTKVPEKYTVEFPQGVTITDAFTGTWLNANFYLVTDTTSLASIAPDHIVRSVFQTANAQEIYETGQLILQFKPQTTPAQKSSLATAYGLELVASSDVYSLYKNGTAAKAQAIFESGLVTYCHPNFIRKGELLSIPNDAYFNKQFYLHNTGQVINDGKYGVSDADIDAAEAWDITTGDSSIIIAVIDQGVQKDHYDLPTSRQVRLPKSNMADTNVVGSGNPEPYNGSMDCAHGMACAGIIAATQNNSIGISGIAPKCKIMPIRLFGNGNVIQDIQFANAIIFADTNGAKIISNSYQTGGYQIPVMNAAIESAISHGKVAVFGAGNTRLLPPYFNDTGTVTHPGNAQVKGMITVGASNMYDSIALYSPKSHLIDIVAPSATGVNCQAPYSHFPNVWTCDLKYMNGYNPWPYDSSTLITQGPNGPETTYIHQCERVAGGFAERIPAWTSLATAPDSFAAAFTGRMSGTSAAVPQVAGVAALMLSVNSCLKPEQIKDLLLQTADKVGGYNYEWSIDKMGQSEEMGYGRLNAHQAVYAAQITKKTTLDLYVKDDVKDIGIEPDTQTNVLWASPDIWIRNDTAFSESHQNPEYTASTPVYVYVRVRNKSCIPSLGSNDSIKLYWAKAGPYQDWPDPWTGANSSNPILGGLVAAKLIIAIPAGEYKIYKFEWYIPNPNQYPQDFSSLGNGVNDAWHFCLLAQVKSPSDPYPSGININGTVPMGDLLKKCNNFAMKNIMVVDFEGKPSGRVTGGTIAIGNMTGSTHMVNVHFDALGTHPVTSEAEVIVSLNHSLWNLWVAGGQQGDNIRVYNRSNRQLQITEPHATLTNLTITPGTLTRMNVMFSFVTEEVTETRTFRYGVTQTHMEGENEIVDGGQGFDIRRYERELFAADGGKDKIVQESQSVLLSASDISEAATYNWYDEYDSLIYTGKTLTVSPEISMQYKLEIIADIDGFESYDDILVEVQEYYITAITPNPASSQFTLNYHADGASSAYIMLINQQNGQAINNYLINPAQSQQTINISGYQTGIYNVVLVCDGKIRDTKTISIY